MAELNKHGLSRYIPSDVQRTVRENSYFGCVICGNGICQIDHVNPDFEDSQEHNSNCMTLLCGSCHDKKTRGIIGIRTVESHMENPFCKKQMPSDFFDFGLSLPKVQFGNSLFINPLSLISIDGVSILSILPPSDKMEKRFRLNAIFHNSKSEEILKITDNVWQGSTSNWDIETVGKKIIIRSRKGIIVLEIENIPDDKFIIHKINMCYNDYQIISDHKKVEIITPSGDEIFALDSGSEIHGDIMLNIINERVNLHGLHVKSTNLNLKGGSISNSVFDGDSKGKLNIEF